MIETYNEGMKEFNRGDVIYAGKKFNEVETLFPQSIGRQGNTNVSLRIFFSGLLW